MAYVRTIWKNREVERPRTYEKIENTDGTITLLPSEGTIIEEGTPIIAETMNNIEDGIEAAHNAIEYGYSMFIEHEADSFHHIPYAVATGTDSYAVNIQGIIALTEGMSIKVRFQNANTGTATLNINGLGAKEIRKSNGKSLSAGNIKAGQILHLVYTGSVFQLLGEGQVQLTDSVSSTSTTTAATPNSVKQAYDKANAAYDKANTAYDKANAAYDKANAAYDKANAALPKTGGEMTGILTAQSNTSYTTRQVRNIILSTADADVDAMQNGDIWIKYK